MAALPMHYLQTFGPAGDPVTRLTWGLLALSLLVCAVIGGLVLLGVFRRRPPLAPLPDGRQPLVKGGHGMRWIAIGTGISGIALFASAVWTIMVLAAIAAPPRPPALDVEVTGKQWWWEVRYPGATPDQDVVTANEIHIPVGEPVRIRLVGGDVIHSFWIPQLGGKTDMIPGQVNVTWLQADKPGRYRGQCAEYCGLQHAHMALTVVADERDAFAAWRRAQQAPAGTPADGFALQGKEVFAARCARCHAVRGMPPPRKDDAGEDGEPGPDLTHLMSRRTLAGGTLPNGIGALGGWIADPQALKPGARMPAVKLAPEDLRALLAYLQTLD
ncbi:cytochrome c oxidase subunit II [Noviherbaspirillum sp. 17J57-3]|uniref:Cytochrome aa3 subunit 2 n=2 Tax=Noviherbaspirillum galbum TaxID=2709383 RepID=A0A6B3STP8_9BURK|nr:cytochrome c oxidase subunit II [Noviherbaspirillum galbum]